MNIFLSLFLKKVKNDFICRITDSFILFSYVSSKAFPILFSEEIDRYIELNDAGNKI